MFRYLVLLVLMLGLGATATLARSDVDVKLVQEKLIRYGVEKADGKMGNKTRNAIRAYQQDWQIPETGEITPDLIARLKREHPATKPQWYKVTNQDCVVWNDRPRPREEVTWTGDCTVSKTSGTGKLVWSFVKRGKSQQSTFEGQHKNGKAHGQGITISADGSRYEGQWKDGKQHGQGVSISADGSRYEGQYKDGKQHGQGVFIWAKGDRYEGQYQDSKKHGQGVMIWADGDRYDGQWKDGKPHGQGVFITSNGGRENRRWNNGCSAGKTNLWINTSKKACGF